jgi:hypothetical protein
MNTGFTKQLKPLWAGFLILLASALVFPFHSSAQNFLNFDGSNDHVISTNAVTINNSFTAEAWFYAQGTQNCRSVFSFESGFNRESFQVCVLNDNRIVFLIQGASSGISKTFVTNNTISNDTWYHVALTYDGSNLRLYLDGVEQTNFTTLFNTPVNFNYTRRFVVGDGRGANSPGSDEPFRGNIDDARLWNVVRTEAEIAANKDAELTGNEPGLLIYWPFNNGTCAGDNNGITTTPDLTSNGNAGNLINFARMGCTSNFVCSGAACGLPDNGVSAPPPPPGGNIPTMGEWAFLLFGLSLFTLMMVGLWNVKVRLVE